MYAAAEAAGFPLLMHVADPPELWDPENAPDFAREHGWLYVGEGYPTLEELYGQVEDILTRFPKLTVIFAHFLFLSNDRERAADLLTRHPNAHFDLTPGTEMFLNFAEDPGRMAGIFPAVSGPSALRHRRLGCSDRQGEAGQGRHRPYAPHLSGKRRPV